MRLIGRRGRDEISRRMQRTIQPLRSGMKIKVRKLRDSWWVFIDGPVPDFSKHRHFSDALAKVQFELRNYLTARNRKLYAV